MPVRAYLSLKWGDVLWDENKLVVRSPKTEHHEGKEFRIIPIFPELRPHLEKVFELAEPGSEFVITRYRDVNANLRTQFTKIIKRAGLIPWPKLFHNLRATRQTELEEQFPSHVVCAWLGNSTSVAREHYLQVTDRTLRPRCICAAVRRRTGWYWAVWRIRKCRKPRKNRGSRSTRWSLLDSNQ